MTIELPRDIEDSIVAQVRGGLFPSTDAAMTEAALLLLERIERAQAAPQVPAASQDAAATPGQPIWERILGRTAEIPDEVWDKVCLRGR